LCFNVFLDVYTEMPRVPWVLLIVSSQSYPAADGAPETKLLQKPTVVQIQERALG
jgi:hypothetical protein